MKTLYLNCGVGAAGDMLTAALLELMPDKAGAIAELNAIGIPNVVYGYETVTRCGIRGTHMSVKVNGVEESEAMHDHHHDHEHHHDHDHGEHHHHHHHHTGLHGIEHIVRDHLNLPETVKEDVLAVYGMIAEAESHAHGVPVTEIHFHEVGTMDALADVSAVCLLLHKLAPEQIVASPVCMGSGQVRCAHGILPVPAPATAALSPGSAECPLSRRRPSATAWAPRSSMPPTASAPSGAKRRSKIPLYIRKGLTRETCQSFSYERFQRENGWL